jgi:glyoxylase-like metal-dependent hydrolase (beta-lactamase superfamily II)
MTETGWRRFRIGEFAAMVVSDGAIKFESIASEFPGQTVANVRGLLDPETSATLPGASPLNCLLLNNGRRSLLIDAGMGVSALLGDGAGRLSENLAAARVKPDDIDVVLLTHLHCDHLWGLIDAHGAPVFPNAEVFAPKAEFDFWMAEGNAGLRATLPPEDVAMTRSCLSATRLSLFEGEAELVPGVSTIPTPGHTIGHTSYLIVSAGARVLHIGDICHHGAVQFARPEWLFRWDDDADLAALTRRRVFEMAADQRLTIVGFHLPFPGVGWVEREGTGFRFVAGPTTGPFE